MIDKTIAKYLNEDEANYSKAREYVKTHLGDEWTLASIGVDGNKINIEVMNKKTKVTKDISINK